MCGRAPRSTARRCKRGNSVYFPDRVVPMLPERISNDLCSLREGEDRPALAVRMTFDADGRKRSHRFHRVMMRSAAKLSYAQAQAAIDGAPDDKTAPLLEPVLQAAVGRLCGAARRPRRARAARARPARAQDHARSPTALSIGWSTPERLDAHRLIEEFMIQANVAAAETLEAKRKRRWSTASTSAVAREVRALARVPARRSASTLPRGQVMKPQQFNRILERVAGTEHAAAGQRGGAALAGAGRIRRRQYRPFRPQPAPLRAFHLADPPLCRPHRPPRA